MEYYSAFKDKEILQYETLWTHLEDMILSKISQPQKNKTNFKYKNRHVQKKK